MESTTDQMIIYDDPEAAKPVTVTGWQSRTGYFYPDEHSARYAGCTHKLCEECGAPTVKYRTKCDNCREAAEIAIYYRRTRKPWDGESLLYSEALDAYYFHPDDAFDAADDEGISDPRLRICEPVYAPLMNSEYFYPDEVPPDCELPVSLELAIDEFNKAIEKQIVSWSAGKYALDWERVDNPSEEA